MTTFGRAEKLKNKKTIDTMFASGKSVTANGVRAVYVPSETSIAGFSVSKKLHKRAVDRNRIKRLMRESYRLNRSLIKKPLAVMFIYALPSMPTQAQATEAIVRCLNRLPG